MKTNILLAYFFCCCFATFSLSSCLNGDNTTSVNSDIAYITYKNNTKVAATAYNGFITSPVVQGMSLGECYSVGYKVDGAVNNEVYTAVEFVKNSDSPFPQTRLFSTPLPKDKTLPLAGLTAPIYSSSEEYWGDRWVFGYRVAVGEKETPKMYFYYDKDNQIDEDGKDVFGENKIIIDLYVAKDMVSEAGTSTYKVITTVGNLSGLRAISSGFVPDYSQSKTTVGGKKYVDVPIQFRFLKQEIGSTKSEVDYIGSWGNNRVFVMRFVQK